MKEDHSYGKVHRIVKQSDFTRIKRKGKRSFSKNFILLKLDNGLDEKRIGIVVTKKVGKANVRNRFKRHIREFFRLNKVEFKESTDFLFIVKKGSEVPRDFKLISDELRKLIKKHK